MSELSVGDDVHSVPGLPGGGLVPRETMFRTPGEVGCNGLIGLETYNTGLGDSGYERGVFQDVCPDGRVFVERATAFLRSLEARFFRRGNAS